MKEKRIGPKIIMGLFIMIYFSWLFWIPFKDKMESNENRQLSEKPTISLENYVLFSEEFNAYFDDRVPFRDKLINLNSTIDYYLFRHSPNADVAIGTDEWLFYRSEDDGDTISDYNGANLYTEEELVALAENCKEQNDFLKAKGKEFVIFIAPNKERIYWEKMPSQYGEPAKNYRALQVVNYLRENTDIRVVYPYDELIDVKQKIEASLYYKTDTHWNSVGGYVGAAELLQELGIAIPAIDSEQIEINIKDRISGDLAGLLNMKKQLNDDIAYEIIGYDNHDFRNILNEEFSVISYEATGADSRKIYIIRDSFATAMADYVGSQFNETYMIHRYTYKYDDFIEQDPDIVVVETVERYLDILESFSIQ